MSLRRESSSPSISSNHPSRRNEHSLPVPRAVGINLENGKCCKVTFKARAEASRGMRRERILNVSPFTNYARFRITLGADSTIVVFDDPSIVRME